MQSWIIQHFFFCCRRQRLDKIIISTQSVVEGMQSMFTLEPVRRLFFCQDN